MSWIGIESNKPQIKQQMTANSVSLIDWFGKLIMKFGLLSGNQTPTNFINQTAAEFNQTTVNWIQIDVNLFQFSFSWLFISWISCN